MKLVVDASVAVKWVLRNLESEADTDRAAALLIAIRNARVETVQPPHWLAEVAAVVSRLCPGAAPEAIDLLDALQLRVAGDAETYKRASRIAAQLDHHLFDTLYHALALEHGAVLLTADERYARKARSLGSVVSLAAWTPPGEEQEQRVEEPRRRYTVQKPIGRAPASPRRPRTSRRGRATKSPATR